MNILYEGSIILAGILWGIISIFIRQLTAVGITNLQTITLKASLSAIIMFLFLFFSNRSLLKIKLRDIWMFIGSGIVSLSCFSLCYFTSIIECGASVAVVLLYTSPIFVLLLSAVLFKEKITKVKSAALILTFIGCIFVTGIFNSSSSISLKGLLTGLGAGLGYGLYSIFCRFALKKYKTLTVVFYSFLFSGLSLIPFSNLQNVTAKLSVQASLSLLGITILCTVIAYFAYTFGLSHTDTGKAAILATVEPMVGTLLGIFAYHESHNPLKVLGIILIFTAVLILNKPNKQK